MIYEIRTIQSTIHLINKNTTRDNKRMREGKIYIYIYEKAFYLDAYIKFYGCCNNKKNFKSFFLSYLYMLQFTITDYKFNII